MNNLRPLGEREEGLVSGENKKKWRKIKKKSEK